MYKLSSEINDLAIHWLGKKIDPPFFLFLNYMEPHRGYGYLPDNYDSLYGYSWKSWKKHAPTSEDIFDIVNLKKEVSPEQYRIQHDWTQCKIAFMDRQIGHLLDVLKELKLYDSSMIIMVSDHGDLFGEHNAFGHEEDLYNELIRVPLIIKYPGNTNAHTIDERYVQNVDLMPEILSHAGLPIPVEIQGQPIARIA